MNNRKGIPMAGSETTPLMVKSATSDSDNANSENGHSNKGSLSPSWQKTVLRSGLILMAIALLVGGGWIIFGPSSSLSRSSSLPPPPIPSPSTSGSTSRSSSSNGDVPPSMRYRPFCMVYGQRVSFAGVIQTSMGDPSQQWSHIPCYAQPEKVRLWASKSESQTMDKEMVNLNGYAVPDAILQLNLEKKAFPNRRPVLGFGSAFTEASSLNYQSLSEQGKERLMELLFGKSGLGYSVGRVHINSCDFSIESYSFDETDGDFDLKDFDVAVSHDSQKDGMLDMIVRATKVFNAAWKPSDSGGDNDGENADSSVYEGDFKLFASPWSPPKWMKNPSSEEDIKAGLTHASGMTGSTQPSCLREGAGKGSKYAKAWALYFSKFITAYLKFGAPLRAITVQNEPEFPAPWEACSYTPQAEADFIGYHLGPQLKKDHPNVEIFMFDHNKDHMVTWAKTILNQTNPSSKYVSGTAYHWYAGGMDRLLDGAVGSPNMHRMQAELQALNVSDDHVVFNSEACHCPYTGYAGGDIDTFWARAERYAHTILADLAAGSNGWVEWNLVLDSVGGPNHLGNLCDTVILAVPHRAVNGTDTPPTMEWEKTNAKKRFGANHGDDRTREELNAMGFPAVHLDAGLAVQPMYFYMGHISRYVRPGSRPVMGIVDAAKYGFRAFRAPGQVVAGGGMNDLARQGIELTAWPCEGSTRQQFHWNKKKQIAVSGHDWLGKPTKSCVSAQADESFLGITLADCAVDKDVATFDMVQVPGNETEEYAKFVQLDATGGLMDQCLVLKKLKNNGGAYGPKGGAQVTYGECSSPTARWKYSDVTREIISDYLKEGEVCMTTGWPFLQMGAFDTPNGESKTTVVILNEARESANYVIYDGNEPLLSGSIPPRSIQTVLLD